MATTWGSYSGREAVGIDVSMSPATVTKDTASVVLTWSAYVKTDGWVIYSDSQTLTASNTLSDSLDYDFGTTATPPTPAGSARLIKTWTQTISTSYSGAITRTLSAAVSGMFNGGTPAHSRSITIPARPPQVPSPATSAAAAYVSDSRINLSWVRPANAGSAGTVWTYVDIWRSTNAGSYVSVATLSGSTTSWADLTVAANKSYRYAVRGRNASGASAWVYTGYVDTTPAAPTSVAAVKSGSAITVTWADNSPANDYFEVRDNGGAVLGTSTSATYTHASPSTATTHQYEVRAVSTNGGTRYSAWSTASNIVQLLAAPAAPDGLSPSGSVVAVESPLVFAWTHVPVDTTAQESFDLRHRLVGGSWANESGGAASALTLSAGSYATGSAVEWQVRTKGAHPDWSPWSPVALLSITATPTVVIVEPDIEIPTPSAAVTWAYHHAGGSIQSGWEVEVASAAGITLDQGTGSDAASSWLSRPVLSNGATVTVRVRVRETQGLWSEWAEVIVPVAFDPPAEPSATATWVDGAGHAAITVAAQDGPVATDSLSVERSTDGGASWVLVASGLPSGATVLDFEAPASGTYLYRVVALSSLPSTASIVTSVTVPQCVPLNDCVWLSGGQGFSQVVALAYKPELDISTGRQRTLQEFDGRTDPVETSAQAGRLELGVSSVVLPNDVTPEHPLAATRESLEALFDLPGPHLYRDPDGRHIYCTLSALRATRRPGGGGVVSFTLTRSGRGDADAIAGLAGYVSPRVVEVAPGQYIVVGADALSAGPGEYVVIPT